MFITDENNALTKKWPSLEAKFGKTKKSNFYRIDSGLTSKLTRQIPSMRKSVRRGLEMSLVWLDGTMYFKMKGNKARFFAPKIRNLHGGS